MEKVRRRRGALLRHERRRAWLATVSATLAEADTVLDAIAGEAGYAADVRARVAAARASADALALRLASDPFAKTRRSASIATRDEAGG